MPEPIIAEFLLTEPEVEVQALITEDPDLHQVLRAREVVSTAIEAGVIAVQIRIEVIHHDVVRVAAVMATLHLDLQEATAVEEVDQEAVEVIQVVEVLPEVAEVIQAVEVDQEVVEAILVVEAVVVAEAAADLGLVLVDAEDNK